MTEKYLFGMPEFMEPFLAATALDDNSNFSAGVSSASCDNQYHLLCFQQ